MLARQSIFTTRNHHALCKAVFFNWNINEAKEISIIEDEPEDDDEELYQSVFIKTKESCPNARYRIGLRIESDRAGISDFGVEKAVLTMTQVYKGESGSIFVF